MDSSLLDNVDLCNPIAEDFFPLLNDPALTELQPHEEQPPVLTDLQPQNEIQPEILAELLPLNQSLQTAESRDRSNDSSSQSKNSDTLIAILDEDTVKGSNDDIEKASDGDLANAEKQQTGG